MLNCVKYRSATDFSKNFTTFATEYFAKNANYDGCIENGIEYPAEMRNLPNLHIIYDRTIVGTGRRNKLYYFNANHLGSGSLITDGNGKTYQTLAYTPYGSQLVDIKHYGDNYEELYRFTGKLKDGESNLTYFGARYYDENIQWLSTDDMWRLYWWLTSYNLCAQNPINTKDDDGNQFPIPWVLAGSSSPVMMGTAEPILMSGNKVMARPTPVENVTRIGGRIGNKPHIERLNAGRKAEGQQLEKMGLDKNTQEFTRIDPKTGKSGKTIPDGYSKGQTWENKLIKDGGTQSLTKQLRIQKEVSNGNGKNPVLNINKEANISKPLQNAGFEITTYSLPPIEITPLPQDNTRMSKPLIIDGQTQ
jgi:RHS repeat-associated protein